MVATQWARLRAEARVPLRRGAWYPVLRCTDWDAVVAVEQHSIHVPLGLLHLTTTPPRAWAVVPVRGSGPRVPWTWGRRYAVCPHCRARAPLGNEPVRMRCLRCNQVSDVGWGDAYFA